MSRIINSNIYKKFNIFFFADIIHLYALVLSRKKHSNFIDYY